MSAMNRSARLAPLLLAACLSVVGTAAAQERKQLGWFFTSELTAVWVGGNSESSAFGIESNVRRVWNDATVKLEGGAIRAQSTLTTRTATGTIDDYQIEEEKRTEKTAEAYFLRARYDRQLNAHLFAFAGTDWLRNTFAGIDSRILLAAGGGNTWVDGDDMRFKTDVSATYTFQEDVVENPFVKTKFPGVRAAYDFWWKLTASTEFASVLTADFNLDNTDDVRLDLTNSLPIAISSKLAFKPSLQLLWRNAPSLTEIDLFAIDGSPTGQTVTEQLQELDSFFKIALVVKL